MRAGRFDSAFAINDAVLAARAPATRDDPTRPYHERWVWDGTPLAGRQVLVRCYHGLGDTLQFCRYLPALAKVAAHVVVEAQPSLLPLLPGAVQRHAFDPARPLPPAEVDVEIMELAHALRLPPDGTAYLAAAPTGEGGVGFCWQGGGWDGARDVPPRLLAPLVGADAVSLQRGPAAGALDIPDPLGGSMDMVRLAALVAGLRAVVTVDTMVAHLAGALGVPAYVLLKHDPDWRWGDGPRCAWYDSVRMLRQPAEGDWPGAVSRLRATFPKRPGS